MDAGSFRFSLGEFECVSVSDGALNYPPNTFFANAAPEDVEEALGKHNLPTSQITTPYTLLFIDTGRHRVLVDTGAGDLASHAGEIFPGLDHSTSVTGKVIGNLRAAGIEHSDIDTVVITHAHPDHVGGTLDEDGRLVFDNAHYFMPEKEWDFWTSDAAEKAPPSMVGPARRNLEAIRDRLTFIDDDSEIVPGIKAVEAYGHTPGHITLSVSSGGAQLLHISDVVLYPLHLEHPEWTPVFDLLPEQAAASKRRIFDLAASENALVFAHHFPPFPNLGHVVKKEMGWQWMPIESSKEAG